MPGSVWLDEWRVDFEALFVAHDWIERHCVVPDGFNRGNRFELYGWQSWATLNHYRIRPDAVPAGRVVDGREVRPSTAFHYRRSQIVLPQKAGKAPYTAAHVCLEGVGPAVFAGFAARGDKYRCVDFGCGCGWEYQYADGEAMGRPWPTPLIQITATSEEQTDNIYDALRPMIDYGPLSALIPKTGEEFIRLPNGGRVDTVTSNATSRLGQRCTYCAQDETGIWTKRNKMVKVAETQRRGLAGMGGRAEETTNGWDPAENSVAQRTADAAMKTRDVFRLHPLAPAHLSYGNKRERRKIHEHVYAGCVHIDLDAIDAEATELYEVDEPQAERFFGNRCPPGHGRAVDPDRWDQLANPREVPQGTRIGLGFDGSISGDHTVLRGCTADGYRFPIRNWSRPFGEAGKDWTVPRRDVAETVEWAFDYYDVGLMYGDPAKWWVELAEWADLYRLPDGTERVVLLDTNQERRFAPLVDQWFVAMREGAEHAGDEYTTEHVKNAHRRKVKPNADEADGRTLYVIVKGSDGGKIDACIADVLAYGAAMAMPESPVMILEGALMA